MQNEYFECEYEHDEETRSDDDSENDCQGKNNSSTEIIRVVTTVKPCPPTVVPLQLDQQRATEAVVVVPARCWSRHTGAVAKSAEGVVTVEQAGSTGGTLSPPVTPPMHAVMAAV